MSDPVPAVAPVAVTVPAPAPAPAPVAPTVPAPAPVAPTVPAPAPVASAAPAVTVDMVAEAVKAKFEADFKAIFADAKAAITSTASSMSSRLLWAGIGGGAMFVFDHGLVSKLLAFL